MRLTAAVPAIVLATVVALFQTGSTPIPGLSLSDADEVRIGGSLAQQFIKTTGMEPTPQTAKIEAYLQAVGNRLAAHAQRKLPYRFRFDPEPAFKSAFALPGGEIFVGGGALAMMDTEDQLAVVLGHEIEHVAQNHCRDRLNEELAAQHLTVETAEQLKVAPFLRSYGHDGELTADREGVKLSVEAGYSPQGAVRLLTTFLVLGQQAARPSSEAEQSLRDRITQIQRIIAGDKLAMPAEKPLTLP
ncbi:MAG TPA: M48 family metalloprotease [Candidatus Acidoferrales bacterium]|nr:M48 family metalloprotease [Candidatus Acidoferrales bacterium]